MSNLTTSITRPISIYVGLVIEVVKLLLEEEHFDINVKVLLLKAAAAQTSEEELELVLFFYGSDFDALLVSIHLEIFFYKFSYGMRSGSDSHNNHLSKLSPCPFGGDVSGLYASEATDFIPTTTATSERSVSALHCIKTYTCIYAQ